MTLIVIAFFVLMAGLDNFGYADSSICENKKTVRTIGIIEYFISSILTFAFFLFVFNSL